jgi:hypothetical protein
MPLEEAGNVTNVNAEKEELYRLSLNIPKFLYRKIKKTEK